MYSATFVTYNCKNIKRSVGIKQLCIFADVIALQETWLLPCDLPCLAKIHEDFGSTGVLTVGTSSGILKGRPFGGVALLWRKSMFQNLSVVQYIIPLISVERITTNDWPVLIFSIYMPIDCVDNITQFT